MKVILIILALAIIVSAGFYMGWFGFSTRDSKGASSVTVSVNKGQIKENNAQVVEKVQDLTRKTVDKAEDLTQKTVDGARDLGQKAVDLLPATTTSTTQKAPE